MRLHWSAPSRLLPHGLSGLLSSAVGAYLIVVALRGNLVAASGCPLWVYVGSTAMNATAGLAIVGRAAKDVRSIFRSCAIYQICLVYFVCRFSSSFPAGGSAMVILDGLVSVVAVLTVGFFTAGAVIKLPPAQSLGVVIGSFALTLLSGYPLQLAFLGEDWWQCVQSVYPLQGAAMVAYIYVPATWAFGVMLFGATLRNRKLIGDLALGGGFAGIVIATLVSTVLMQEIHFPEPASTQKLWLPCPEPPAHSWSAWAVKHLDTSALARAVLARLRGPP
jgi:hypothetical protein